MKCPSGWNYLRPDHRRADPVSAASGVVRLSGESSSAFPTPALASRRKVQFPHGGCLPPGDSAGVSEETGGSGGGRPSATRRHLLTEHTPSPQRVAFGRQQQRMRDRDFCSLCAFRCDGDGENSPGDDLLAHLRKSNVPASLTIFRPSFRMHLHQPADIRHLECQRCAASDTRLNQD